MDLSEYQETLPAVPLPEFQVMAKLLWPEKWIVVKITQHRTKLILAVSRPVAQASCKYSHFCGLHQHLFSEHHISTNLSLTPTKHQLFISYQAATMPPPVPWILGSQVLCMSRTIMHQSIRGCSVCFAHCLWYIM